MGKVSPKARIALIVTSVAVVACAAVLLGVLLTLPKDTPIEYLPKSAKGEFLVAESQDYKLANGQPWLIARTYDGNEWENVPNLDYKPPKIDCKEDGCLMYDAGNYVIRKLDVPQQLIDNSDSPLHLAARLYMQAAFGANREDLEQVTQFYGSDYGPWILDQMQLTPTLSRSYYRARANARPGRAGSPDPVTKPCDLNTRWHRYAFENRDKDKNLGVSLNSGANRFVLSVDGQVRGEVTTFLDQAYPGTGSFPLTLRICGVDEVVGGPMQLSSNLANCDSPDVNWMNPAIEFVPNTYVQVFTENQVQLVPVIGARPGSFVLKWRGVPCTNASDAAGNSFIRVGTETYRFDKRIRWIANTVENPIQTGLTDQCPVVARTYQTRDYCVRRASCGSVLSFKSALFTLDEEILRAWYLKSKRYVYYVTNLRLEDEFNISPCSSGTSRWRRITGACPAPTALDATTRDTIAAALSASTDKNPYVRDITLSGANCVPNANTIGAQVQAGGECFEHVHPDLFGVRDFTFWVDNHDGNQEAMRNGAPNPIAKFAVNGEINLPFPSTHPMTRFYDRRNRIPVVGRFGDQVNFPDLSTELQTEEVARLVGALRDVNDTDTISCGSPGETETIAELGSHYQVLIMEWWETLETLDTPVPYGSDHRFVLQNMAIKAQDQLRQRVAWSLSNFIVAADLDSEATTHPDGWTGFYDIFVRHAFGNFRDILRDVSNNPVMGVYLSFVGNQAYAVQGNYPDENYAREIMQLFSIGLWRLNDDGTQQVDEYGLPQETYDNDDIMDFARLWTGFERQIGRNNLGNDYYYGNFADAMVMRAGWHDRLPKAKLDEGYLGDTYPLCDDLPAQTFLRKGARYEYTGAYSVEGDTLDKADPSTVGTRGRFAPTTDSALHRVLCAPDQDGGACAFPLTVILPSDLQCNGDQECNAQRVLSVKIYDPVNQLTRYYAYIAPPCVRLTLFDSGKLMKRTWDRYMCGDPSTRVGAPVCCRQEDPTVPATNYGPECLFANEVMSYATMEQRCASMNLTTCSGEFGLYNSPWSYTCADLLYMWTSTSCSVQLQVYRTGRVAIVDPVAPEQIRVLIPNSNNFFRVRWADNAFPTAAGGACPEGCNLQPTPEGDSCMCNFTVTSRPVYSQYSDLSSISTDDAVNSIAQQLFIGAPNPNLDGATYSRCQKDECKLSNVVVWLHNDDNGGLSERTVFELPPFRIGGRTRYLLNRLSTVSINNHFSFRNPPHFAPLLGELHDANWVDYLTDDLWSRRAEYEVEALLEHLFEHQNTAVFVSYRLIQHMVTSNPSPRYVNKVVQAFRTGTYGDIKFSQRYGDLAATVYAILMDHEARSPIVESDTTFGMLRDPLMQLYHLMRALNYNSPASREIYMTGLEDRGGVQPFASPSVFGFYLPEFRPFGVIGQAGLVGPQVQIATTPNLMGFLNGITSLISYGLTPCDGFAVWGAHGGRRCDPEGARLTADGNLTWVPPQDASTSQILDELDLLLTAGRLHEKTRTLLANEYDKIRGNATFDLEALRHMLKLLVASPEFETNTYNHVTEEIRQPQRKLAPPQGRPFKAIVVIFEAGGSDSFNLVVPHSNCPSKDVYEEYKSVRQGAAMDKSVLLPIDVPANTQPCNTFGVHPAMPNLHSLYNDGDALFTVNIGVLVEPVTQEAVLNGRARLPPSIGAHNIMTRSAQNLYAQSVAADGILGRLTDALLDVDPPYPAGLFSMAGNQKAVQGDTPADFIAGQSGVVRLRELQELRDGLNNISAFKSNSVFAENQAELLFTSLNSTETLGEILGATNTTAIFGTGYTQAQLQQAAKLIKTMPDAGYERLIFFTTAYGFDTHFTFDLSEGLGEVDKALGSFAAEMKAQGRWDDVVVMSFSEFGRTMTSNGQGTDHGWGGNNWIAGGKVKGGQILGKYPHVLTDDSELSLGRGRLIPTTSFEALWKGVGEWFGVTPDLLKKVLPNMANFPEDQLFTKEQLFEN